MYTVLLQELFEFWICGMGRFTHLEQWRTQLAKALAFTLFSELLDCCSALSAPDFLAARLSRNLEPEEGESVLIRGGAVCLAAGFELGLEVAPLLRSLFTSSSSSSSSSVMAEAGGDTLAPGLVVEAEASVCCSLKVFSDSFGFLNVVSVLL